MVDEKWGTLLSQREGLHRLSGRVTRQLWAYAGHRRGLKRERCEGIRVGGLSDGRGQRRLWKTKEGSFQGEGLGRDL